MHGAVAVQHAARVLQRTIGNRATERHFAQTRARALDGAAGSGQPLPHLHRLRAAFGPHLPDDARAHTGPRAAAASRALGAEAYTVGRDVVFAAARPDLHTVAHEAAHVVQQRAGLRLPGGVGSPGDAHERHADAVADAVVAGRPAAPLLARMSPRAAPVHDAPVQRKTMLHRTTPLPVEGVWEHGTADFKDPLRGTSSVRAGEVEAVVRPPIDTSKDPVKGRKTAAGYDPPGWYWVGQFVVGGTSRTGSHLGHQGWVRFHLLNAYLGGDGHNTAHLVPTRNVANTGQPWKSFEDAAKRAVEIAGAPIHYHVEAKFHAKPAGPAQQGDDYFPVFPAAIDAEFSEWDASAQTWGAAQTVSIPPNQLQPPDRQAGNETHYLDGITVGELTGKFGRSQWLAERIAEVDFSRVVTVQQAYDAINMRVTMSRGLSTNPVQDLNGEWKPLQDALLANAGQMLRISPTVAAQDLAIPQADITSGFTAFGDDELAAKFAVPKPVVQAVKALLRAQKLTLANLYDHLWLTRTPAAMMKEVDPHWDTWVQALTSGNNLPKVVIAGGAAFKRVTTRHSELGQIHAVARQTFNEVAEYVQSNQLFGSQKEAFAEARARVLTDLGNQLDAIVNTKLAYGYREPRATFNLLAFGNDDLGGRIGDGYRSVGPLGKIEDEAMKGAARQAIEALLVARTEAKKLDPSPPRPAPAPAPALAPVRRDSVSQKRRESEPPSEQKASEPRAVPEASKRPKQSPRHALKAKAIRFARGLRNDVTEASRGAFDEAVKAYINDSLSQDACGDLSEEEAAQLWPEVETNIRRLAG